ncbi:MAG: SDR family NAD(P)-dependent oxidoreductase, partial [Opitutales bacterium]
MKNTLDESIAIVGMGCRFPGRSSSPKAFWDLLCQGTDAIVDVPPDRWDLRRFYSADPDRPGKTYIRQGGFLQETIDTFDPLFFGISPREAESMDPQQRLLLEVTWEAFEDAGIVPAEVAGSPAGVFIGGFCLDNQILRIGALNRELIDSHTATSSSMTILSNRISYIFNLKGPSMTLDTACSSSLVAVHLACQSLWSGESTLALAGGVNVMLRPEFPVVMSKGKFLSTHGRCMAFDERAEGYSRGEGAGVVLLKPLSQARADRDPIYAVIRMTGVNQDGRTAGISLPDGDSQENLIRSVYRRAGISPADIGYVEAHGTGTRAGDPVEAGALHRVLSEGRGKGQKCPMGTLKTNMGHLEAAAGVAGLMKAALAIKHGQIPPNLHFERANPDIPFEELCVRVPTELEAWPSTGKPARAAVNSFGYGGTNAHALLEEAPAEAASGGDSPALFTGRPIVIPLSAHTESALKDFAGKVAFFLRAQPEGEISLADMAYSTALRRSHHDHRLALTVESMEQLWEGLQLLGIGETSPGVSCGRAAEGTPSGPVFVCTGMGPQWWGMGRELREKEPVFRGAFDECDALFHEISGWSLIEALSDDRKTSRVGETQVAQPANFALQVGLAALLSSWGVRPAAIVGHSVGEVAAAHLAGALSLADAVSVSFHRSRLQQKLAGEGGMLAIGLPVVEADSLLQGYGEDVSVAAVNSPSSFTLSGNQEVLNAIAATLDKREVFNRFLRVEVAYHSSRMDPIREEIVSSLAHIEPRQEKIPLYSTVAGGRLSGLQWGNEYWWRNVRHPVQFAQAVDALLFDGFRHFLEVGPHPVLGGAMKECFLQAGVEGESVPSLRREEPELSRMRDALGKLYTLGMPLDWKAIVPSGGRFFSLPGYPWQRERYWKESKKSIEDRLGAPGHIFLNTDLCSPEPGWTVEINEHFFPYLDDHRVRGNAIFPGAGYVEAGLAVHRQQYGETGCILEDIEFTRLLVKEEKRVQLLGVMFDEETRRYSVSSRIDEDESPWKRHAMGRILPFSAKAKMNVFNLNDWRKRCGEGVQGDAFYEALRERGLDYQGYFRPVKDFFRNGNEFLIRIEADERLSGNREHYRLHPSLLDAGFQGMLAMGCGTSPLVAVSIERLTFHGSPGERCWCHAKMKKISETELEADFGIVDERGEVLVEVEGVYCQVIPGKIEKQDTGLFYVAEWSPVATPSPRPAPPAKEAKIFVAQDEGEPDAALLQALAARNFSCVCLSGIDGEREADRNDRLLREALAPGATHDGISLLYLRRLDAPEKRGAACLEVAESVDGCMTLVRLIQGLRQAGIDRAVSLQIVTRGAQSVDPGEGVPDIGSAPLWGLGALVENEHPGVSVRLIDLDPSPGSIDADGLVAELCSGYAEKEVAFRSGRRLVRRLVRLRDHEEVISTTRAQVTRGPVELAADPSVENSLCFVETTRRPPGEGEMEIQVHSVGLDHKDFLKANGRLPRRISEGSYSGDSLGMECSGYVTAVGPGVRGFNVGDEIVTAVRGGLRTYATIPVDWAFPRPAALTEEEAPVLSSCLTAWYGLIETARLQEGETILIHDAAEAVGLAALRIAQSIGAEVHATAAGEKARDFLTSLGVRHVMDSSTLDFVREVRATTGGRGIDVVFSGMSGDGLFESFSLLAPCGRFIDIGKEDIAANSALPMKAFIRNLAYCAVDIDRLFQERPQLVRRLLQEVARAFDDGVLSPIPVTVFPAADVTEAFRCAGDRRHIGKIVVKMFDEEISALPNSADRKMLRADGTYLVTGGTGGFGLEVARWLVANGVGQVVLASRRGASSPEIGAVLAEMDKGGTRVKVVSVDITDGGQVGRLLAEIESETLPLRGVFHGAMVLDDGLLMDLD